MPGFIDGFSRCKWCDVLYKQSYQDTISTRCCPITQKNHESDGLLGKYTVIMSTVDIDKIPNWIKLGVPNTWQYYPDEEKIPVGFLEQVNGNWSRKSPYDTLNMVITLLNGNGTYDAGGSVGTLTYTYLDGNYLFKYPDFDASKAILSNGNTISFIGPDNKPDGIVWSRI